MLLEKLCNASSPSGYEDEIRSVLKEELKNMNLEYKVDNIGNIVVHKSGSGPVVLIDAHMDEVGFIITSINENGTLKFRSLGGIIPAILPSKTLYIGENKVPGVIGHKPIHLKKEGENKKIDYKDYYIDIGALSREDAKKHVSVGDYAVFQTKFKYFGEGLILSKGLDDRAGCGVLLEILKEDYNCDLYVSFSVMEEVGCRGAMVSAFPVKADIGIAVEGTVCADMPNVPERFRTTEIGKGPALSIMDQTSIYTTELLKDIVEIGESNNIPYQFRKSSKGGNNASAIKGNNDGAKVIGIAVPCRYIHSSMSVCSIDDFNNTVKLLKQYLKSL